MNRRRGLLLLGAGACAAGLGAGVNWWRTRPARTAAGVVDAFFAASFADADGRQQPLSQWRGRPLIVNFWATWCPPCVEEMPDLQRIRDTYRDRGVEVIGIGIDNAAKIVGFRRQHGLSLPLLVAGAGGSELSRSFGNTTGALPFTVLISPDGRVLQRHLGQIKPEQLRRWLDTALPSG
jgi:thiol-disulfide isomerase/thioredoxin